MILQKQPGRCMKHLLHADGDYGHRKPVHNVLLYAHYSTVAYKSVAIENWVSSLARIGTTVTKAFIAFEYDSFSPWTIEVCRIKRLLVLLRLVK
jgi:hypothetical protein